MSDPACAVEVQMQVEIEADWLGLVRMTFIGRRCSRPRAMSAYYAWHCLHAEPVTVDPLPAERADSNDPVVTGPALAVMRR